MRTLLFLAIFPLLLAACKGPNRTELGYGFYSLKEPRGKLIRRERDNNGNVVDRVWVDGNRFADKGGSEIVARFDASVMVLHFPDTRDIEPGDIAGEIQRIRNEATYSLIHLDSAQTEELGTIDDIISNYEKDDPIRQAAELPYRLMGDFADWLGEATERITKPTGR